MIDTEAFLDHTTGWMKGFEVGMAFLLMVQHCPHFKGVYHSTNDEQLLLFAHRFGYDVDWKPMKDGMTSMEFVFARDMEGIND